MKCKDCSSCEKNWGALSYNKSQKINEYTCIGVKHPFKIKDINAECTQYSKEYWEEKDKKMMSVKDNKVKDGKCVNSVYKAQNLPVNQIDKRMTMFNLLIISILGLEYTNNANDGDEWVKYACRDIIQEVNSQKSNNFPDYPNLFLE